MRSEYRHTHGQHTRDKVIFFFFRPQFVVPRLLLFLSFFVLSLYLSLHLSVYMYSLSLTLVPYSSFSLCSLFPSQSIAFTLYFSALFSLSLPLPLPLSYFCIAHLVLLLCLAVRIHTSAVVLH